MVSGISLSLSGVKMKFLFSSSIFVLLIFCITPHFSFAFSETARHGYLSCSTCHYSTSGRGLLTPYGKTLSNELYSYWKTENENESLESETPWWRVGGQARLLQFVQDSKSIQKARFFPMQAEVEGAIDKEAWAVVASAGAWRSIDSADKSLEAYSRNHYLLLRPSENWAIRYGHFRISHGLGLPDHTTLTNQGLGWTHSHETYNLELSYLDENNVIQGTWITPSELLVTEEMIHGGSINIQRLLFSNSKVGFNVSRFVKAGISESQVNLHTVVNLTEASFVQAELAQRTILSTPQINQQALFARYSYQLPFGVRPLLQVESAVLNKSSNLKAEHYYVGSEWFPMQNFDLLVLLGQESQTGIENNRVFTAVGHFYY